MNFFGPRSLWDAAPHFVDAISSVVQSTGLSQAVGNVVGDVVEGAGVGAGLSAIKGSNPLTGAVVGGVGGGALGAYNNWSGLTGVTPTTLGTLSDGTVLGSANATGSNMLLDDNGDPLTDANGNPLYENTSASPATASDGTTINPVSQQAAGNAGGSGGNVAGNVTKGVPGGISNTSMELGALAALSSVLNKPQVGTYATPSPTSVTQPSTYSTPLTSATGRTQVNPNLPTGAQPNYWEYGGPEQTYFTNNSLASFGFARGGSPSHEFTVATDGHHVRGPGTGTSDDVPAMLSNKEYVLTYDDLSRIGNKFAPGRGDANERGAAWLDRFRRDLAHSTGQPQFPPKQLGRALNEPARRTA